MSIPGTRDFHHGLLAVRGETPRCTEIGGAPAWQGATREQIGAFVTEEQRRKAGCSANRMQRGFCHGLLGLPADVNSIGWSLSIPRITYELFVALVDAALQSSILDRTAERPHNGEDDDSRTWHIDDRMSLVSVRGSLDSFRKKVLERHRYTCVFAEHGCEWSLRQHTFGTTRQIPPTGRTRPTASAYAAIATRRSTRVRSFCCVTAVWWWSTTTMKSTKWHDITSFP